MRENRKYGSEGGEVVIGLSYPYQYALHAQHLARRSRLDSRLRRE